MGPRRRAISDGFQVIKSSKFILYFYGVNGINGLDGLVGADLRIRPQAIVPIINIETIAHNHDYFFLRMSILAGAFLGIPFTVYTRLLILAV